ncbi:multidrug efflux SMR transporter [Ectothiorhodospiraceae bacterium 2226]|nr:multidrug efflux SMR transporter [Ectothiorhodospiraceae bacterium 2226]
MSWLFLFVSIVLEVTGTTFLKLSYGLTKLLPSVLMFVFYALSFVALALALKRIDLSIAYAIWAGLGTALIASIGIIAFQEPLTPLKAASIAMIIAGVVGLNLSGGGH